MMLSLAGRGHMLGGSRRSLPRDWLICLVTDRRRLVQVMGATPADGPALVLAQVRGAVDGGVDYVQIRERDLDGRRLLDLVRDAVACARGSRTRILVNDRTDVAIAADAGGVHLREDSPSPGSVRTLVPAGMLVGRSIHDPGGVADAIGAGYLLAGTVFGTVSKGPGHTTLGSDGLASIVARAGRLPVLAIGGITPARIGTVVRTGASGIAAIGAFLPSASTDDPATEVKKVADAFRNEFDSTDPVS